MEILLRHNKACGKSTSVMLLRVSQITYLQKKIGQRLCSRIRTIAAVK
jgi:hypothetical protein